MKQWDIWLAFVKFTDKPDEGKIRPVLIIDEKICFVLVYGITSHKPRDNFFGEYNIMQWKESGLDKPSTIRLSTALEIEKDKFIKKIGELDSLDIKKIMEVLKLIRGLL